MTAERSSFVFCGPLACFTVTAIVDTGSDRSVVPSDIAAQLGLPLGEEQLVNTGGGPVVWNKSKMSAGLPYQPVFEVDAWIGPAGDEPTLGADALRILGFKLVPPTMFTPGELEDHGIPVPDSAMTLSRGGPRDFAGAATAFDGGSAEARMAVCRSCSYRGTVLGVETCTVCHCALALKTRIAGSSCPMGRW
jgi:hypothetical protein